MNGASWAEVWHLRTNLYAFLGNSLLHAMSETRRAGLDESFWREFPLEPANEEMGAALDDLQRIVCELGQIDGEQALRRVVVEYTQLFIGPGAPKVPLWESLYRPGASFLFGQPTFDMRTLLRERGLALGEGVYQLEDHLGVELLYLSAVSEQFIHSIPSGDDVSQQILFIEQHPLAWIGQAQQKAAESMTVGYYAALLKLVYGVLLWDCELLHEYMECAAA